MLPSRACAWCTASLAISRPAEAGEQEESRNRGSAAMLAEADPGLAGGTTCPVTHCPMDRAKSPSASVRGRLCTSCLPSAGASGSWRRLRRITNDLTRPVPAPVPVQAPARTRAHCSRMSSLVGKARERSARALHLLTVRCQRAARSGLVRHCLAEWVATQAPLQKAKGEASAICGKHLFTTKKSRAKIIGIGFRSCIRDFPLRRLGDCGRSGRS